MGLCQPTAIDEAPPPGLPPAAAPGFGGQPGVVGPSAVRRPSWPSSGGAASLLRDGDVSLCERISGYATADLAYIVEIERTRVKVAGGSELATAALRATTVFRREGDSWRIVRRHADPIAQQRAPESVVQLSTVTGSASRSERAIDRYFTRARLKTRVEIGGLPLDGGAPRAEPARCNHTANVRSSP
jgi:hypothetical protein